MENLRRSGLQIVLAALAIGIAGDSLLRSVPWGLNIPIMAVLCATAIAVLRYRSGAHFSIGEMTLLAGSIYFSSWFAIRDSEPLLILNFLAVLLIGVLLFLPVLKLDREGSGVIHYAFTAAAMGLSAFFLPFVLLTKDLNWNSILKSGASRKTLLAVRGVLIATPLVLIFGALFSSADAAFEGFVTNTFQVVPETLALHAFFTAFFAWPAAGFLRAVTLGVAQDLVTRDPEPESEMRDFSEGGVESVLSSEDSVSADLPAFGSRHIPSITLPAEEADDGGSEKAPPDSDADEAAPKRTWSWQDINSSILPDFLTLGSVEVGIVLGSLNVLFFAFVLLQLPYLFGGFELVQTQPGLKLADYARRGFGELFAASMLVLPVLMVLHWLIKRGSENALNLFRYLAAVQIGLLFVVMLSAFQRMLLLTGTLGYGMTLGRFYPMAFMIWLAIVFLLFGYTVFRGERGRFAWNAAVSALAMVAVLNFVNPADYVVRTNIELMKRGRSFDAEYNSKLGADAIPAIAEAYPDLNMVQQDIVLGNLVRRQCRRPHMDDLRVWNYSRARAENASRLVSDYVRKNGCP